MNRLIRLVAVLALVVWTGGLRLGAEESPAERMKLGHCGCKEGEACWHYLRSPLRPPEDPCRCGLCAAAGNCSTKERPDGWGADCTGSQKPECFWKRHAASWGITCSRCADDKECTSCDGLPGVPDADVRAKLAKQLAIVSAVGPRKADPNAAKLFAVGWSAHFYVVTDIPNLKVLTQGGAPRVVDTHEIVHLFLERAEKAYDDFVQTFGDEVRLGKPMAIFLAAKDSKKEAWQAAYFGSPRTNMLFGGGDGKVAGGFCWNGFATSTDDYGADRDLHGYVRHMIGHILFSCWHGVAPHTKECPKWAFAAAADWLCKIHPFFADWTTFCHDETTGASGSGKDWDKKAVGIAAGRRIPIEKLFGTASLSHLSYDDHVRSWSMMDTMLREDKERWLATLRLIREGKEHAAAFREGLATTPDDFDARWADRMLGKRKTMADVPKDAGTEDGGVDASARRRRITGETDPITLARAAARPRARPRREDRRARALAPEDRQRRRPRDDRRAAQEDREPRGDRLAAHRGPRRPTRSSAPTSPACSASSRTDVPRDVRVDARDPHWLVGQRRPSATSPTREARARRADRGQEPEGLDLEGRRAAVFGAAGSKRPCPSRRAPRPRLAGAPPRAARWSRWATRTPSRRSSSAATSRAAACTARSTAR
jgi:hypothetical protein